MTVKGIVAVAAGFLMAGTMFGDGSYQKTTQITGGPSIPAPLLKLTAVFMPEVKHVMDPNTEIMMVHGNRMVTVTMNGSTIWDMDKGTMTTTDNKKRQYSVIQLQQLQEMTKKFMSDVSTSKPLLPAQTKSNPDDPRISIESSPVNVQNTGAVKQFSGVTAKETVLTLKVTMKVTDPKSGQSVISESLCYLDVWKADRAPGYDDVQDFYRRLGEKMGGNKMESQRASAAIASRPEAGGMSNVRTQANKIKGITVLEVERVSTLIGGRPLVPSNDSGSNRESQNSGNSGADRTPSGATGALGSMLGKSAPGLFGKKPASSSDSSAQARNTQQNAQQSAPGVLSETTTQLSNFSNQPVVLSEFEVPAGYKEVPSPILQLLK
jgi:hypothetical protein